MHKLYVNFSLCAFVLFLPIFSVDHCCLVSIDKCGTNMLSPILEEMTGKNSMSGRENQLRLGVNYKNLFDLPPEYLSAILQKRGELLVNHMCYSVAREKKLRKENCKVVLLIRDPRDQTVSFARFIKQPNHWMYWLAKDEKLEDIITELIVGGPHNYQKWNMSLPIENVREVFRTRLDWLRYEKTLLVRFEDLIGPQGGGKEEAQLRILHEIANFLNVTLPESECRVLVKKMYGSSATFTAGSRIGRWKDFFTAEHKRLFKEVAGELLIDLGYERDHNW